MIIPPRIASALCFAVFGGVIACLIGCAGNNRTRFVEPPAVAPLSASRLLIPLDGDFYNGDRVQMLFRPKSAQGNPYWLSSTAALAGQDVREVARRCSLLTMRERVAGRVPAGYAYFRSGDGEGRYILVPKSEVDGPDYETLPHAITDPDGSGYVFSPYFEGGERLGVNHVLPGEPIRCPYTQKWFRLP